MRQTSALETEGSGGSRKGELGGGAVSGKRQRSTDADRVHVAKVLITWGGEGHYHGEE